MDTAVSVRSIVTEAVGDDPNLDKYIQDIEATLGLAPGTEADLSAKAAAAAEAGDVEASALFDRWGCIRCVAKNIGAAVAIGAAIAAFGPGSTGVVPYIAAKFGISEAVAGAAVGGVKGAALAKLLCKNVC